jgi:hypothetical protein
LSEVEPNYPGINVEGIYMGPLVLLRITMCMMHHILGPTT